MSDFNNNVDINKSKPIQEIVQKNEKNNAENNKPQKTDNVGYYAEILKYLNKDIDENNLDYSVTEKIKNYKEEILDEFRKANKKNREIIELYKNNSGEENQSAKAKINVKFQNSEKNINIKDLYEIIKAIRVECCREVIARSKTKNTDFAQDALINGVTLKVCDDLKKMLKYENNLLEDLVFKIGNDGADSNLKDSIMEYFYYIAENYRKNCGEITYKFSSLPPLEKTIRNYEEEEQKFKKEQTKKMKDYVVNFRKTYGYAKDYVSSIKDIFNMIDLNLNETVEGYNADRPTTLREILEDLNNIVAAHRDFFNYLMQKAKENNSSENLEKQINPNLKKVFLNLFKINEKFRNLIRKEGLGLRKVLFDNGNGFLPVGFKRPVEDSVIKLKNRVYASQREILNNQFGDVTPRFVQIRGIFEEFKKEIEKIQIFKDMPVKNKPIVVKEQIKPVVQKEPVKQLEKNKKENVKLKNIEKERKNIEKNLEGLLIEIKEFVKQFKLKENLIKEKLSTNLTKQIKITDYEENKKTYSAHRLFGDLRMYLNSMGKSILEEISKLEAVNTKKDLEQINNVFNNLKEKLKDSKQVFENIEGLIERFKQRKQNGKFSNLEKATNEAYENVIYNLTRALYVLKNGKRDDYHLN